jgi:hypothetical protein
MSCTGCCKVEHRLLSMNLLVTPLDLGRRQLAALLLVLGRWRSTDIRIHVERWAQKSLCCHDNRRRALRESNTGRMCSSRQVYPQNPASVPTNLWRWNSYDEKETASVEHSNIFSTWSSCSKYHRSWTPLQLHPRTLQTRSIIRGTSTNLLLVQHVQVRDYETVVPRKKLSFSSKKKTEEIIISVTGGRENKWIHGTYVIWWESSTQETRMGVSYLTGG